MPLIALAVFWVALAARQLLIIRRMRRFRLGTGRFDTGWQLATGDTLEPLAAGSIPLRGSLTGGSPGPARRPGPGIHDRIVGCVRLDQPCPDYVATTLRQRGGWVKLAHAYAS